EPAPQRPATGYLRSIAHDLGPAGQSQPDNGFAEELGPGSASVEEDPGGFGPGQRQRQARQPATAAEIEGSQGPRGQGWGRMQGALDMRRDRPRSKESPALSADQDPFQRRLLSGLDQCSAGSTTTRRRGSSPSEIVDTPSMSVMAS